MSKNCIIYEVFDSASNLNRHKGTDGLMRLEGVFGVCGVKNNNGRVYEHRNYSAMISEMSDRIKSTGCPGELEHPNSMNINLENISHKIEQISINEQGVVTGTIVLLDTPKGQIAQKIIEGGLPLFISSRARGNVQKDGTVKLEELKTYDLVGTPGFSQAELGLSSNQKFESLNESCCIIYENEKEDNQSNISKLKNNNTNMNNAQYEAQIKTLNNKVEELSALVESQTKLFNSILESDAFTPAPVEDETNYITKESFAEYLNLIQEWVTGEYTPTLTEGIQHWVTNEYSPELQKWFIDEAATTIQEWVEENTEESFNENIMKYTETLTEGLQNWIVDEYTPTIGEWFEGEINESNESKPSTLDNVDKILTMLEGKDTRKVIDMGIIKENKFEGEAFMNTMPDHIVAKWNMASDMVKENISTRAKLYDFNQPNVCEEFWAKCSFAEPVIESVNGSKIISFGAKDDYIRESLRRVGKKLNLN